MEYEDFGFPFQNWTLSIVETLHHVMHSEVIVVRGEEGDVVLAVAHEHHNVGRSLRWFAPSCCGILSVPEWCPA